MHKTSLNIQGIHCKACKTLIETEVSDIKGVKKIKVDHIKKTAQLEFNENKTSLNAILATIENLNYIPKVIKEKTSKAQTKKSAARRSSFSAKKIVLLISIALLLITAYFFLNASGAISIMERLNDSSVGYPIILLIGLLAGFHCVGMCGGLIVAYSAGGLKKDKKQGLTPHFQYNFGRLVSYTVIGGILGGIGSFFGINPTFTGTVILIASGFMVAMGLSFIFNWSVLERIKLSTPEFIARYLYGQKKSKKPKGPLVIGLLNGFMPCGPLQAMQLYALTVGNVLDGALSMGVYALGTIPLMLGFGAFINSIPKVHIARIIKFSGALIIVLALFMANRGLANFGLGFRAFASNDNISSSDNIKSNTGEYQTINMDLTYLGYQPNVLYIKPGIPVRWVINVKQMTGCTDAIMIESLGIKKDLKTGENIINFVPPKDVKEIKFSCWMRMVWGKFVISESGTPSASAQSAAAQTLPKGSSCGGSGSCGGTCGGSGSCGCGQ